MSQSQKNKKREQLAESINYPRLEFVTAGWVLTAWGNEHARPGASAERRKYLKMKLREVQAAIAAGLAPGGQANIPFEIVAHEYEVVRKSVEALRKAMKDASDPDLRCRLVRDWKCKYDIRGQDSLIPDTCRPLFIQKQSAPHRLIKRILRKNFSQEKLSQELTADFFGCTRREVVRHLKKASESTRWRKAPSNAQRYLAAMFILSTKRRGCGVAEGRLLKILTALHVSGYRPEGLYHLAKYARGIGDECRFALDWKTIGKVCEAVRSNARSRLRKSAT